MKIKPSKKLQKFLLSLPLSDLESINTMRFDEDIVIADGYVEYHTDNTEAGKDSIMFVITNDGEYDFSYEGSLHALPPGKVFRFDGNKTHALITLANLAYKKQYLGRFSAILWDIPTEQSTDELIPQLKLRQKELVLKYTTPVKSNLGKVDYFL